MCAIRWIHLLHMADKALVEAGLVGVEHDTANEGQDSQAGQPEARGIILQVPRQIRLNGGHNERRQSTKYSVAEIVPE